MKKTHLFMENGRNRSHCQQAGTNIKTSKNKKEVTCQKCLEIRYRND